MLGTQAVTPTGFVPWKTLSISVCCCLLSCCIVYAFIDKDPSSYTVSISSISTSRQPGFITSPRITLRSSICSSSPYTPAYPSASRAALFMLSISSPSVRHSRSDLYSEPAKKRVRIIDIIRLKALLTAVYTASRYSRPFLDMITLPNCTPVLTPGG